MKQHRQNTVAMALTAVVALIMAVWVSPAFAQLSAEGRVFEVFRTGKVSQEHQRALITVVKTRQSGAMGLVFLQTRGPTRGEGMVCGKSDQVPNLGSHECRQKLTNYEEILTIGKIPSKFCDQLRQRIERLAREDPDLYTADGMNPVASRDECKNEFPDGKCVCYDISHEPPDHPGPDGPPNSGSGTGGHN